MTKVRKFDVFFCHTCKLEGKVTLNGVFITNSIKDKRKAFKSSCGCSIAFKHSKWTAERVVRGEADRLGYKFYGFVDNVFSSLVKSKVILSCPTHGKWSSGTAANFIRGRTCPLCANHSRGACKIKPDKFIKAKALADSLGYIIRSEVTDSSKNSDRIDIECGHCNSVFDITLKNFFKGRKCPNCAGKNQTILYLHRIADGKVSLPYYKIGITNNLEARLYHQNSKNNYQFYTMHTWKFKNSSDCKACERYIKKKLIRGRRYISDEFIVDGKSEIVDETYYLDILDAAFDFGGVEYVSCPLITALCERYHKNFI